MSLNYRIQYKIVENGKVYAGIRVIEQPVREYLDHIHHTYQDATYVYIELLEEFEEVLSLSSDSIILIGMKLP